jgi:hypothetical protein
MPKWYGLQGLIIIIIIDGAFHEHSWRSCDKQTVLGTTLAVRMLLMLLQLMLLLLLLLTRSDYSSFANMLGPAQ